MTRLLKRGSSYDEVYGNFVWNIPKRYNIADDVCDRWARDPDRVALIYEDTQRNVRRFTFAELCKFANQLANTLRGYGLGRGDRVSVLLSQSPECVIAHVACWKAGMVSAPCSVLFGGEAIAYRLNDSAVRVLITDNANYPKVASVREQCPHLEHILMQKGFPWFAVSLKLQTQMRHCDDRAQLIKAIILQDRENK